MSTLTDHTKLLQSFAGTPADGLFGPQTAAALVAKLGLGASADARTPGTLRVCVDAGHGMANRRAGVYDPGCVSGTLEEADIALEWAGTLVQALKAHGAEVYLTRTGKTDPVPVGDRARMAANAGCTVLVSIHVNDAESVTASGCETLFSDDRDFAVTVHRAMARELGLRDRGVKPRSDLAVLKFAGLACLVELGFIQAEGDMRAVRNRDVRERACDAMAAAICHFRA